MKYKLSQYNLTYETNEGYFIFNTSKLGLARVDKGIFELLRGEEENGDIEEFKSKNPDDFKNLIEGGYVVRDELDEYKRVWHFYDRGRFLQDILSITIIPTNDCNLACTYCYQKQNPEEMSLKTQKALIAFIKERLKDKRGLAITWYGGEPLLHFSAVKSISYELIEFCSRKKLLFKAKMITNGTLLNSKIVSQMTACGIKTIQITLDGPKKIHDARRPYKVAGKASSFDSIIRGLKSVKGKMPVSLRINVDRNNKKEYAALIERLRKEKLLDDDSINVGLGFVRQWTEHMDDIENSCLDMCEFGDLQIELKKRLNKSFLREKLFPSLGKLCTAVSEHCYVVEPLGNLLTCWIQINHEKIHEMKIGDIYNGIDYDSPATIKWRCYEPLDRCKACRYFPLCVSGCPYMNLYQKHRTNERCEFWKRRVDKTVNMFITDRVKESGA